MIAVIKDQNIVFPIEDGFGGWLIGDVYDHALVEIGKNAPVRDGGGQGGGRPSGGFGLRVTPPLRVGGNTPIAAQKE
jgi:hypothetical protein